MRSGGGTLHSLQVSTETQAFTEITEKIKLKAGLALVRSRGYASKRDPIMKQAPGEGSGYLARGLPDSLAEKVQGALSEHTAHQAQKETR